MADRNTLKMRLAWAIAIAASAIVTLALLSGCVNARYGVLTSANGYVFEDLRYEEQCGAKSTPPVPANCKTRQVALLEWKKYLKEASDAAGRGGSFPKQKTALKAAESASDKAKK
jgi:hypothetical protein